MAKASLGKYALGARESERAAQIWPILIGCAHRRQTLTYTDLARLCGHRSVKALARQLGHILYFCRDHKLPPLTCIVVNKNNGHPGEGFTTIGKLNEQRERVFNEKWYLLVAPSPDALARAYKAHV